MKDGRQSNVLPHSSIGARNVVDHCAGTDAGMDNTVVVAIYGQPG